MGYAATEHGNQSDTVTRSTELVTPATTRRGLYVGVTRGQQDNTIRVVTDTHDLDEARDVLEAVLAADRADVPAVTQRRQLTTAVPSAPAPRPRCVIPNWFDDTNHQAADELADAHEALDDQRRQDARIERRIRDLTDDLNQLRPRCDPYDTAIAGAHDDVNQAQDRKRQAERAVTDSGPFSRRAARRDLADATDNLATAQSALEALTRCAAPLLDRRDQLRHEHDRLHPHATTNRRLLRLLDDHETNVADAKQTVDALDTWKHWATGHRISPEQLAGAVDVLEHTGRADHTALAGPLATWMDQTPPRTATAVRRVRRAAARTTRPRNWLLMTERATIHPAARRNQVPALTRAPKAAGPEARSRARHHRRGSYNDSRGGRESMVGAVSSALQLS